MNIYSITFELDDGAKVIIYDDRGGTGGFLITYDSRSIHLAWNDLDFEKPVKDVPIWLWGKILPFLNILKMQ